MKDNVKAALLSAFVLPGVGQLFRGRHIKGGVLMILTTVLLIAAFVYVAWAVQVIVNAPKLSGQVSADPFAALPGRLTPGLRWLGAAFICLWIYGVADALLDRRARDNDGSGSGGEGKDSQAL